MGPLLTSKCLCGHSYKDHDWRMGKCWKCSVCLEWRCIRCGDVGEWHWAVDGWMGCKCGRCNEN